MSPGASATETAQAAPATTSANGGARYAWYIAATAVAAALRFAALGRQPLWLDEATDAAFAARRFWDCVFAENVHPPLYRTLLHLVILGWGDTNFVDRLLPAIFGILAVPAAGLLARRFIPRIEVPTLLFVSTSPFLIYFSQENRDYSLFILLTLLATWAFLRFCESGRGLPLYCALCILLLYTHYLSVFVLLAHEIVYWMCGRHRVRGWVVSRLVAAAVFAPWLFWAAHGYHSESRLFVPPALLVPGAVLRFFLGYGIATPDALRKIEPVWQKIREEGPIVAPAMCLFAWLAWKAVRFSRVSREIKVLAASILLVPWAVLLGLMPWAQLAQERYLAFQAPFALMLAAAGLAALRGRARLAAGTAVAVIVAFSLAAYYGAPGVAFGYRFRYAKENWAGAAAFLRDARADAVIVAPNYLQLPLNRYSHGDAAEIPMLPGSGDVPDWGTAQRVAVVMARVGEGEEQLRATMDSRYRRIGATQFSSQNMIQVIVYDTSNSSGR